MRNTNWDIENEIDFQDLPNFKGRENYKITITDTKMETLKGLTSLFSSPRFQGILVAAFLQVLVLFNVVTSEQGEGLILIIQGVIGAAIFNKTADKIGDKNIIAAGVSKGTVNVEDVVKVPPME